ncbi:MAG: glycosyltransferase family 2 protein [Acetobacteraceae bacterium]
MLQTLLPGGAAFRDTTFRDAPLGDIQIGARGRPGHPAGPTVAVLIPCYNEELAVARVVEGFRASLPGATILVYDNNSSDRTRQAALAAGAVVRAESLQGKGHVVRRMFADVEADIYVLVDGDDTYDPAAAPVMVRQLIEMRLDMVTAIRQPVQQEAYRLGHRVGNRVLSSLVCRVFGNRVSDVLSGYRVFSRRFVKSFPALASGFETETEFTIHALELRMPIGELPSQYRGRSAGSRSKLHTISDGLRILRTIMMLVKQERPLQSFGWTGAALLAVGLAVGVPVILQFLQTGLVPRLPTALLATGLVLASSLSFVCGLVLEQVARGRQELKRLAYLAIPATGSRG